MMLTRCPWGEESLLREDTDESLWFFGPAGENNYRVAGVGLVRNVDSELNRLIHFLLNMDLESGEDAPQWEEGAGGGGGGVNL